MLSSSARHASRIVGIAALHVLFANSTPAQCNNAWAGVSGLPGTSPEGVSASALWDPDGGGPLGPRVVVAGAFTMAGNVPANGIAMWDPVTRGWSMFGTGIQGTVSALVVLPNNQLVVGGTFTAAGGVPVNNIARWNGFSWAGLGAGCNSSVVALTVMPNGDVVAGGSFQTAGGAGASLVARWNGSSWSALGSGLGGPAPGPFQPPYVVHAVTALPNGELVAGGRFAMAGAVAVNHVARWDGAAWSAMGTGTNDPVFALRVLPSGDVVAGGAFTTAGGVAANRVARWNGVTWAPIGGGMSGNIFFGQVAVFAFATLPNGDLVAGGRFPDANGFDPRSIARWDGASWVGLGTGTNSEVRALSLLPSGALLAGGTFTAAGGNGALRVALWNGATWSAVADGLANQVQAVASLPNGDLVAAGATPISRRDASGWSVLGATASPTMNDLTGNGSVLALTTAANGDVLAGGTFTSAGGVPANRVARWNGVSWSPLGGGISGTFASQVSALATFPNGHVIAAGTFASAGATIANNIARWDGVTWSALGGGVDDAVQAVKVLANGDVVAGGRFVVADGIPVNSIARWDGATWSSLGGGLSWGGTGIATVNAIDVLPNGDLVVAGEFTAAGGVPANNIARWNGASWSPLGPGLGDYVKAVVALPDGDVVAGGAFTTAGATVVNRIARWNGSVWSPIGAGANGEVVAFAFEADGDLIAGGAFTTMGNAVSAYVARLGTNCPATAVSSGIGCPSSGGANQLVATTLPWVDSTFRASGTGLPMAAIVLALTSVTPIAQGAVPLTVAFPQAGPGCDVLVSPDILSVLVTFTGTTESSFFLPNTPPLVGVTFFHQLIPIEVGAGGVWTSVTATNALQLTAGSF